MIFRLLEKYEKRTNKCSGKTIGKQKNEQLILKNFFSPFITFCYLASVSFIAFVIERIRSLVASKRRNRKKITSVVYNQLESAALQIVTDNVNIVRHETGILRATGISKAQTTRKQKKYRQENNVSVIEVKK